MQLNLLAYRLLIILLSPAILGHIIWLSIKNKESRYFWQRLGFHCSDLPTGGLWFHCASVGEVNTLLPLLKNLQARNAQLTFILTTNTITGGRIVTRQKLDYLYHCYLPFDWMNCIRRFIARAKPAELYVMETEIWPNLFAACEQKKIPLCLINARLSSKTTSANRFVKSLLRLSLAKVKAIYARSDNDADAYRQLGADEHIIKTIGNLKFTTAINISQPAESRNLAINRDYVLLASTHQDEEKRFYDIWKQLNRDELLVIAPRHPERSASIISQLDCKDIAVRSKGDEITTQTKIFLLDTIGELKDLFAAAKLVIMGGSFTAIGGHNIMEPASYNNAIITGPHMENFKEELALMLEKNAIVQVPSYDKLKKQLMKLLDDEHYRSLVQNNTKKLSHNVEIILEEYTRLILSESV
jgi:3-deoxy-D-manno-octulosonic-acid transferase